MGVCPSEELLSSGLWARVAGGSRLADSRAPQDHSVGVRSGTMSN